MASFSYPSATPNFSRFSMIHPSDGRTDRRTVDSIIAYRALKANKASAPLINRTSDRTTLPNMCKLA